MLPSNISLGKLSAIFQTSLVYDMMIIMNIIVERFIDLYVPKIKREKHKKFYPISNEVCHPYFLFPPAFGT